MGVRRPVVAGQFYPAGRSSCVEAIQECLKNGQAAEQSPQRIVGGIVPHAGWTFSGSLAAKVFAAVRNRRPEVDTFLLFGAAHSYVRGMPAVWAQGAWETPLGSAPIDEDLAAALIETGTAAMDQTPHRREHSIEVQVPFVQHLFPQASIVPVVVPPDDSALAVGRAAAAVIEKADKQVVCIASTDLTHYGPNYGFMPRGVGPEAIRWAHEVNDRQFIDAAVALDAKRLLESSTTNYNACGGGAAAAAVVAVKELGTERGVVLGHTNSNELMMQKMGTGGDDSVGYVGMVF